MRSHSSVPGLSSSTGNISDDQKGRAVCRPVRLSPLPHRPLVSILIPSYNHGRYLSEAIESVLQQTYSRLEVVICDDGSTDASLQILERYRLLDERIKLVRQANGGQSMALNAAFRESAGQIICLLDDDDVFLPDKVQLVVNAFTSAPASGLAVNRMRLVDERRKYVGEIPALYDLPCGWQGASLSHTEPQTLLGLPPSSGLSLHRSVAQIIFPLPDGLKLASDKLIVTLAPLMTPITALEAPLSEYRVHGSNSAGVTKFTQARLRDWVSYEREIWMAWRRYLASPFSGLPPDFPLPSAMAPSLMECALARFQSDRNFKAIYHAIPRTHLRTLHEPHRLFWRVSVILPHWLFCRSFDFVYGHTRLKMMARRILNRLRNGLWAPVRTQNSRAAR